MNRDDIIRMAREAGFCHDINHGIYLSAPKHLERFAALVAAAERKPLQVDKDGWYWLSENECIHVDLIRKVEAAHGIGGQA